MVYKVGMIIGSLVGGGTQRIVETLANTMSDLGHEVVIFTLKGKVEIPVGLRARVFPLLGNSPEKKRHEIISYLVEGGEVGPLDLMLTHGYEGYRIMGEVTGVNCYHVVHNAFDVRTAAGLRKLKIFRFLRNYLKYRFVFQNKKIITVSKGVAQGLIRYFGVRPENVQTIYNPFCITHIRNRAEEPAELPDGQYIIHVGSFIGLKRHDVLLRAYAYSSLQTKIRLVLMGEGPTKEKMVNLAKDLGIEARVDFLPWQNNPYPYIKNAKLLALSSDSEGLPTVLIEALILGTPVVSTDCPYGPSEVLTEGLAKFLVPLDDVVALAAAMKEALSNPPTITNAMVGKFDHQISVERYLGLINGKIS